MAEVCDWVLFLSRGQVILAGEPQALIATHGAKTLEDLFVEVTYEGAGS